MADVNEPSTGYLWGNVARHGLTYRHYGEFIATRWCNEKATDGALAGALFRLRLGIQGVPEFASRIGL